MNTRTSIPLLAAGLIALAACEADQEATEDVRLDAPEEIENAPLADTVGPEGLDFVPSPDTATAGDPLRPGDTLDSAASRDTM